MPVLSLQQPNWESNVYVITTTRVFILAGVVQLGRSLYQLISRYSGVVADTNPIARASPLHFSETLGELIAEVCCYSLGASQGLIGADLTAIASDTLSMASMDQDIHIDINGDLELGIQQPRRSYQSHRYPYRPRTLHHEQPHRSQASTEFESPIATVE